VNGIALNKIAKIEKLLLK